MGGRPVADEAEYVQASESVCQNASTLVVELSKQLDSSISTRNFGQALETIAALDSLLAFVQLRCVGMVKK